MKSYYKLLSLPPTFPRKSVIMLLLMKLALFGVLTFLAWDSYRELGSFRKCLRLSELSGIIDNLDEVLTMSAKMAAVTGDKSWEERYRNFEPNLNCAIQEALKVGEELGMSNVAVKVNAANIKLVSVEKQAFDLVHKGEGKAAFALLCCPEYESEKKIYRKGMERIAEQINVFVNREDDENYFKNCILVVFVLFMVPALIISIIVIFVMIKRYEHELKRCECRFKDLSEITNNWIWEIDRKMRFTYVNHNVKEILGYAPEEVLGKTPAELIPHSELAGIRQLLDDLMNNPRPFLNPERKIMHKDGTRRTIRVSGIPLYDHKDEFNGYRGICQDTTSKS